ncbi:MAG TPA: molybdopterin cofactor-binding domain-containing protein, partial [Pseudonocardia sp.]|nr:molybdopterin cofactor-binding domain-containing protein [Pseudonocardia sp.]
MTTTAEPTAGELGRARTRKEDARLITGRTRWTDNITLNGMLHMAMVRSPVAHGRIVGIDTEAAKQMPNVVAVYTGADLDAEQSGIPCAWPINADATPPRHVSIATDTVRFAGEIVAIVVARDAASAKDATEAVEVDIEPLDPVIDMEAALADGSPVVHPELGGNKWVTFPFDSVAAGATSGPTADEAIAAAESDPDSVVVKRRWRQQRLIPAFMEPRSVVVDPTGEQFTIWSATQVPHVLRTMLGVTLGFPEHKLRVIAPDVGGGFGGKLQVTPEEI